MVAKTYNYEETAEKARQALREAFPNAAIETEEGIGGRVHVRIISPALNDYSEREKQSVVWDVLRRGLGEDAEGISFVLTYGTDELP
ncbi:MAG: hypothetical protein ACLFU7_02170 [Armatimonadota bacterium]